MNFRQTLLSTCAVVLGTNLSAQACSVCYGDPESDLTRGAMWGVLVLGIFVYAMLMGMVGLGITWYRRARILEQNT